MRGDGTPVDSRLLGVTGDLGCGPLPCPLHRGGDRWSDASVPAKTSRTYGGRPVYVDGMTRIPRRRPQERERRRDLGRVFPRMHGGPRRSDPS